MTGRFSDLPIIGQGDEAPGRWVERGVGRSWEGLSSWKVQHGRASLVWFRGEPINVIDVLLSDGRRGSAGSTIEGGWSYLDADGRRWIHGTLEIEKTEIRFKVGSQPKYEPPPNDGTANLEFDVANDRAFVAAMQNDEFAAAFNGLLRGNEFIRLSDDAKWQVASFGHASAIVVGLRGLGESYTTYKLWITGLRGVYPDLRSERESAAREKTDYFPAVNLLSDIDDNTEVWSSLKYHLTRLGWRVWNDEDTQAANKELRLRALSVLARVKVLEQTDAGPTGSWTKTIPEEPKGTAWFVKSSEITKMSPDERVLATGQLPRRLRDLARTGRISENEFHSLAKMLSPRR